MQQLLTLKEAATVLNVQPQTMHSMRRVGSGPRAVKVGKYLRYDPVELQEWLRAGGDSPRQAPAESVAS
jgi:predicted DNA-binding transcriptional regulator AlpA